MGWAPPAIGEGLFVRGKMGKLNGNADPPDDRGYVKVWRRTLETIFPQGPYAVTLWVHLLLEASHKDGHRTSGGVILKRGQLHTSWGQLRMALSRPNGRSVKMPAKSTIKAIFDRWSADGRTDTLADGGGLVVTICNYDRWQTTETLTDTLTDERPTHRPAPPQEGTRTTRSTELPNDSEKPTDSSAGKYREGPYHESIVALDLWFYEQPNRVRPETEAAREKGLDEVRLIFEKDMADTDREQRPERLRTILAKALVDDFWSMQIRSLGGLRKKGKNGIRKWQNAEGGLKSGGNGTVVPFTMNYDRNAEVYR
jgi:hypothetical protein